MKRNSLRLKANNATKILILKNADEVHFIKHWHEHKRELEFVNFSSKNNLLRWNYRFQTRTRNCKG